MKALRTLLRVYTRCYKEDEQIEELRTTLKERVRRALLDLRGEERKV